MRHKNNKIYADPPDFPRFTHKSCENLANSYKIVQNAAQSAKFLYIFRSFGFLIKPSTRPGTAWERLGRLRASRGQPGRRKNFEKKIFEELSTRVRFLASFEWLVLYTIIPNLKETFADSNRAQIFFFRPHKNMRQSTDGLPHLWASGRAYRKTRKSRKLKGKSMVSGLAGQSRTSPAIWNPRKNQ